MILLNDLNGKDDGDAYSYQEIKNQIQKLQIDILETEFSRPPHHNSNLAPHDFILQILEALYQPHHPLPDSGFRVLLRSSTMKWKRLICQSVGVDIDRDVIHWDEDKITDALGKALSSSKNQFGILVGPPPSSLSFKSPSMFQSPSAFYSYSMSNKDTNLTKVQETETSTESMKLKYRITFPSDAVDFNDGTCWIECRLLDPTSGALMVVMGWQLKRQIANNLDVYSRMEESNNSNVENDDEINNGVWFIDGLDWQDFRDMYRPGIGREEWMRICG